MVAIQLSQYCEDFSNLHPEQIGDQRERLAIDAISILVHIVQKKWEDKKLATVFFIEVKSAFDHMLKKQLLAQIVELVIDGNLVI